MVRGGTVTTAGVSATGDAVGWASRPPAEAVGEEAGAALSISQPLADGERWLLLALPARQLAGDAAERAAALLAEGLAGEAHLALPRAWQPPVDGRPATLALPAPGSWRADSLFADDVRMRPPELLCRLLLAEALTGIAAAHGRGLWHGLLAPTSLWFAGASPERLVADCPRDPRVVVVGCGILSLFDDEAQAALTAAAPRRWLAPELLRGARPGPAADLWSAGAIARALLADGTSGELVALLDELQATEPRARPAAAGAAARARDLALAGLARWQRSSPPPPRLVPTPAPLFAAVAARHAARETAAVATAPPPAPAGATRWAPALPARAPGALRPLLPFFGRLAGDPRVSAGAPALWLSLAPTAMAGILSVLLALALLLAV
jgi:hypothetical protein